MSRQMKVSLWPQSTSHPAPSQAHRVDSLFKKDVLSPSDFGLTGEEWMKQFPLLTSNSEWGGDSDSDIEVVRVTGLPPPRAGRAVEGVTESDPFAAAQERNLHSTPILSKPGKSYAVFAGINPGIYQTW